MQNWQYISLFISVAAIMVFIPGPNTLYILTRSIQQGYKAGLASSLGVQVGTMIHIAIAALGLSVIIVSSALAFSLVKYAGAGYLIFLGVKTWLSKDKLEPTTTIPEGRLPRIFLQGVVVNVLNPKTALFFFAFLPQFVDPTRGIVALQIVLLGMILVGLGTTSDILYAMTAGGIGLWLRRNATFLRLQGYVTGSVYIGLGLITALTGSRTE